MNIDGLLEELDYAVFDGCNEKEISAKSKSTSALKKQENKLNSENNAAGNQNIDSLLEDLDDAIFRGKDDAAFYAISEGSESTGKEETIPKHSSNEVDKDIEAAKKETSLKYSSFGYEIHKKLKESRSEISESVGVRSSWTSKKAPEKSNQLAVSSSILTGKHDVYAEPTFGLRLINPLVSTQFIQSKMAGKQPVAVDNITYHLKCGDKNTDWVFAGAVVFKSGLKTSQKGSQYCIWKISDLKGNLQTVSVYLFSKACSDLWKIAMGTVVAILNATPFNKDEQTSKNDLTLTVKSADQVMIWGGSRDYGICKAKKKNGDNCTSFVNKSACEFCVYHVKTEYKKFSNHRADLQFSSSGGLNGLRNKVLGKNEVFYGGKSYSAFKPPSRDNKVRKRDNQLLNMLPLKSAKQSAFLGQFDGQKLERLAKKRTEERIETRNENVNTQNVLNEFRNTISNASDTIENPVKTKPIANTSDLPKNIAKVKSVPNTSEKGFASRLHMLKEAGQRMIETGETTRVTLVNPQKKSLVFATVFNSETDVTPSLAELESRVKKKTMAIATDSKNKSSNSSLRKPSASLDFELHVESASPGTNSKQIGVTLGSMKHSSRKKTDQSSGIELHIETPRSTRTLKFNNQPVAASTSTAVTMTTKKSTVEEKSSKVSSLIKLTKFNDTSPAPLTTRKENEKNISSRSNNVDSSALGMGNTQINTNFLRGRFSTSSANIHERRKNIDKMNAISLIKKRGSLAKNNPNRVKPDLERKMSVKRRLEEEQEVEEETQSANKKSILPQRFVDLMNARSKHEDLADVAELIEQQNYFNKLEKKEQLEEKMLSTYKVPCKAVTCLKCKYKWFSASDLCRADGHPIKVIDAFKRFFKCDNCSSRTVSLEIIPLINCKNCGNGKWSRAAMIRDKIVKSDKQLCIRGDEQKHLNSLSGSVNLNLLIPE